MKTSNKSKISFLELVFPPISSQDAVYIEDEPAVEERLRDSDFYMICGKPSASFSDFIYDEECNIIIFSIVVGEAIKDCGHLKITKLPFIKDIEKFIVQAGSKYIQIIEGEGGADAKVIERFTPEGILWLRSKCYPGIVGFNKYKELLAFDLLYVGIAKVGDSYERLVKKGHKARMKILSNESQRNPEGRVSDEIFLLFFRIEPLVLSTFGANHEFTDEDVMPVIDSKRIVADAEKAFVSLLKPEYNIIKFKKYPKGKDVG